MPWGIFHKYIHRLVVHYLFWKHSTILKFGPIKVSSWHYRVLSVCLHFAGQRHRKYSTNIVTILSWDSKRRTPLECSPPTLNWPRSRRNWCLRFTTSTRMDNWANGNSSSSTPIWEICKCMNSCTGGSNQNRKSKDNLHICHVEITEIRSQEFDCIEKVITTQNFILIPVGSPWHDCMGQLKPQCLLNCRNVHCSSSKANVANTTISGMKILIANC